MRITTQRSVRGTNALLAAVLGVSMLVLAWGISIGNVYVAIFVGVVAALCFVLVGTVNLVPDDSRSEATERTLRVAVGTLEHLRGGHCVSLPHGPHEGPRRAARLLHVLPPHAGELREDAHPA